MKIFLWNFKRVGRVREKKRGVKTEELNLENGEDDGFRILSRWDLQFVTGTRDYPTARQQAEAMIADRPMYYGLDDGKVELETEYRNKQFIDSYVGKEG